ncbi:MAG: nucleotidyltransferase family protein [Calothrix sp. MO_192.B10]|nr:nucleotidyltransferase family protein [Calothrix sp. MO_192.B10]
MTTLFHTLLYTSLATIASDCSVNARKKLSDATQSEWEFTLETLRLHRLVPLVFFSLQAHGLTDAVPSSILDKMQAEYGKTRVMNSFLLLTLDALLKAMEERNLHPILWKGVVLADSFYPAPGTRIMEDIDFAIPADEMEEVSAAFKSLGFQAQHDKDTEDAVYFVNPMGVVCDVHHRVRLFEGKESMNLTTKLKPQHTKASFLPVLEPNAMLVHLSVHLDGHLPETGPMLCWIMDIAFVLRKWGALLEPERIEQLMPDKKHFISLLRTIRFLEQEFGEKIPECLASVAKSVEPFSLAAVLRQRRLALWGLPSTRGWLRLTASKLGFQLRNYRPDLQWSDLFFSTTEKI